MEDHYITLGEFGLLVGVFVAPFLLAGVVSQYLLQRRAGLGRGFVSAFILLSSVLMLVMTWALSWVIPPLPVDNYGAALIAPSMIAAAVMTTLAVLYTRVRRPAA